MKQPNVVYLSSSAHSDWRSAVKTQYQHSADVILVGPCEEHGLSDTMGAPGDSRPGHKLRITQMLSKSHILFGYIPSDRYRSFNIMLEIGLAYAWGKKIILVNEARSLDSELGLALSCVDQYFPCLDQGLGYLQQLLSEPAVDPAQVNYSLGQQVEDTLSHQVYLSGQLQPSDWIEVIKKHYRPYPAVVFNPPHDLAELAASDILFAYRDEDNNRLFNIPLTVGYASALAKRILFVNQGDHHSHAYDYVKPFVDGYFTNFEQGLKYLDYTVGIESRL